MLTQWPNTDEADDAEDGSLDSRSPLSSQPYRLISWVPSLPPLALRRRMVSATRSADIAAAQRIHLLGVAVSALNPAVMHQVLRVPSMPESAWQLSSPKESA